MSELQGFNLDRMRDLAGRINNVVAKVTDYQPINSEVARVAVTLSTAHVSQADATAAIARATNNQASPVLGSFRAVPNALVPTLIGFVSANREVVTEDDARAKRFQAQTASILMDPTDESLWKVVEEGGATLFVRTDTQDLHTALASVRTRDVRAPQLQLAAAESIAGEFISYVNAFGELKHGFVVQASDDGNVEVLPSDAEDEEVITEDQVVEAHWLDDELKQEAAAAGVDSANFDSRSKESMKEYYKRMYSYAPDYLAKVIKQIDDSAAV
jgi:hypothetical protein